MTRAATRIGVMFSETGPYSVVTRSMLNGAHLAFSEFAEQGMVALEPVVVDPGGDLRRYSELAAGLLGDGIRHVVGCYTSSSRKEVIPLFEKHDALLWYPSHYEGFESSDNVIYTGASPNQHILPLIDHLIRAVGRCGFCVGSNYIWAWENNRILREGLNARGGRLIAERYLPVGETDVGKVVAEIVAARPDFVFSTLIGDSAYQFFRDFRAACAAAGIDQIRQIPVASCSLSEPELEAIGPAAVDGHLSASVYFSSLDTAESRGFVARYAAAFPDGPAVSADAEASYIAVRLLGEALAAVGDDGVPAVKAAVSGLRILAPQGPVWIDPETCHAHLTPRIGRSNAAARFDVLAEAAAPVAPDPYLVRTAPRFALATRAPGLRVV